MSDVTHTPRIQVPPVTPSQTASSTDASERRTVRLESPTGAAAPPPHDPSLTHDYAILEKIGDGGMGVVYLARDRKLGRYVAIKRLSKTGLADEGLRKRFFREAESIAALHHNNIVHVYTLGQDDDGPYIVMEYVAGPPEASPDKQPSRPFTLADKVHRDGPLSATEALGLVIKICRAMEIAHQNGVIHRDLKPSNILFDKATEPKIVDFGLAHRAIPGGQPLTVPGEKMLSLGYGAPEQEKDATTTDERSDVYGLGGLLYFSLTGQNPRFFREKDIPESLRMVIVRALETDPNKRWQRVSELTEALVLIHAPSSIEMPTAKTTWRCKWCDTVNPVGIQFCGKCGWNGGETCRECNADSRVGIRYCGVCGADAREYERAFTLLDSLRDHVAAKDFEHVAAHAGQISGFVPVGLNGQKIVDEIQRLRERAEQAFLRREYLRSAIDREFKLESYETVGRYIVEFQTLSADTIFDDMHRDLPGLIRSRDLRRAREALDKGRFDYVWQTCARLLEADPQNKRARSLLRSVMRQRMRRTAVLIGIALIAGFVMYVLSAAPVYRAIGRTQPDRYGRWFHFVDRLHDATILRTPLEKYAAMYGVDDMFETDRSVREM